MLTKHISTFSNEIPCDEPGSMLEFLLGHDEEKD